jgi:oligoribonuclease (3'-5' exoribonuclease)
LPRTDSILWIDLETTGSSNDADIIEFGGVITDSTPELSVLSTYTTLVKPTTDKYESDIVTQMHETSGLTLDLSLAWENLPSIGDAEKAILKWINETIGFSTEHIPWGGSGVGHFDSKYIRRDWPYISKRLTYWVYDVGVMRRMLRLAGIENTSDNTEVKTHRALDDALLHASEARDYLKLLKEWSGFSDYMNSMRLGKEQIDG